MVETCPESGCLGEGRCLFSVAFIASGGLVSYKGGGVGLVGGCYDRTRVGRVAVIPLGELVAALRRCGQGDTGAAIDRRAGWSHTAHRAVG